VDRTAVVTERDAAIHAASGLLVEFGRWQRLDELAPMLDARVGLFITAVMPFEFEEAGRLTHVGSPPWASSLGRGGLGGPALRFQFEERATVILGHQFDELRHRPVPIVEQFAGAGAAGIEMMPLDENPQAFGVEPQGIAHAVILDADGALTRPLMVFGMAGIAVGRLDPFEIGHRFVGEPVEPLVRVIDIGDAARHAGAEIAPGLPQNHHDAAGHVFAAVIAGAFDHRDRAGIAYREPLARDALEIGLAGDCAVQNRVADNDIVERVALDLRWLAHDDAAAAQPLADIVVGVAQKFERDAARQERAEAAARRAPE